MYRRPIAKFITITMIVLLNFTWIETSISTPLKNGLIETTWMIPCGTNIKLRHKHPCQNELNDKFVRYYIKQLSMMSKKYKALCKEYIVDLYDSFVYFDPKPFFDQNSTVKLLDFDQDTPVEKIQKEFHTQLINQATRLITVSRLYLKRHYSINFDMNKRMSTFKEVASEIKGLLCEIEADVKNNDCSKIDLKNNLTEIYQLRFFQKLADVTGIMIEDWYFYKNFENFIQRWEKFFKKYAESRRKRRNKNTRLT